MHSHLAIVLLAVCAALAVVSGHDVEKRAPGFHLPHIHINLKSAKVKRIEGCIKAQLPHIPGGMAKVIVGCIPSAIGGAGPYGACVAAGGAAKATSHVAHCLG